MQTSVLSATLAAEDCKQLAARIGVLASAIETYADRSTRSAGSAGA